MATQKIYGVYHTDFRENGGGGSTPSSTIIVNGTVDGNMVFTPAEGEPSFVECAEAFKEGTPIMLKIDQGGVYGYVMLIESCLSNEIGASDAFLFMYDGEYYEWHYPDDSGDEDDPIQQ